MRLFTMTMTGLMFIGITVLAQANPAMLPKHPGYPSKGEFANDTDQSNLTYNQSIQEAAKSGDTSMAPALMDPNNGRLLKHQGAGRLPIVEGMINEIELPEREASGMPMKKE